MSVGLFLQYIYNAALRVIAFRRSFAAHLDRKNPSAAFSGFLVRCSRGIGVIVLSNLRANGLLDKSKFDNLNKGRRKTLYIVKKV